MDVQTLRSELNGYVQDRSLWEPTNLWRRSQVLAFAAFVRQLARARRHQAEIKALHQQSAVLARRCEQINEALFADFRARIRNGEWRKTQLRSELDCYTSYRPGQVGQLQIANDGLDLLLRGVLQTTPVPPVEQPRTPERGHLETTPARIILELLDRLGLTPADSFYDLGAGLGEVVCLVHLLSGVPAVGIEVEAAYWHFAQRCATHLALTKVRFIHEDAQRAELMAGTVFFLFTPFTGLLLQTVLDRLAVVACDHPIRLGAYGSCARVVAQQPWLRSLDDHYHHEDKLALFVSRSLDAAGDAY